LSNEKIEFKGRGASMIKILGKIIVYIGGDPAWLRLKIHGTVGAGFLAGKRLGDPNYT